LHSTVNDPFPQSGFNHPVKEEIQQRYFSDVKELLNSLKDGANKEKNSVVEEVIASLDNPRLKCPIHLNNLALEIKNNLFEKNQSLFSKDEEVTFDSEFAKINEKAQLELVKSQQDLLNPSIDDVNLLLK
jgi:hypothetical protein